MEDYHFWQDFFDTYQSLSDGTKALWLIVPATFLLGLIALILRYRVASREAEHGLRGDLIYTIHQDGNGQIQIYRYGAALDGESAFVLPTRPAKQRRSGNVDEENKGRIISSRDGV